MQKLFRNSKKILAFIFAIVILAASLMIGGIGVTADACDVSKIDYWDGTVAAGFASGTGKEEDPYIIATAEQLAYCCLRQNPGTSSGKYYKVSDDIKTFVMQPEDVVDLNTLLALESPLAVAEYFESLSGVKNWLEFFNNSSFNGSFDGNGATIYGLYVSTDGITNTNVTDVGLFPQYDGGADGPYSRLYNTCKNIAVKNSYYFSKRRMGAIVGAAYLTGYGAKYDGRITIDSCEVVNCYMTAVGGDSFYSEQGIVACGGGKDTIILKNVLVKDVYAKNTEKDANINIVGNGTDKVNTDGKLTNTVSDSIILGSAPYGLEGFQRNIHEPYLYTNVVTDMPSGEVECVYGTSTTKKDYTDHIYSITETGSAFKAAANMLDWKNTWIMGANGPELRVFHTDIKLTITPTTHTWQCNGCGLQECEGVANHTFVLLGDEVKGDGTDVYVCSGCDYICDHNDHTDPAFDPGDCVTQPGVYERCNVCDWYIASGLSAAPGHKFEKVEADIGDCKTIGNIEYWECTVCNNRFTTEDIFAPMNTAAGDSVIYTGYGPHTKECDENGKEIILYDDNGHWYRCAINGGRLDLESNSLGEDGVIKHKFKKSVCVDCGYECTKHTFELTGKIDVMHKCDTDEKSELKCTRCGHKTSIVTKAAGHTIVKIEKAMPTDESEGVKEHYKCEVCKELYLDAEGKTVAENATLVIPRVLSEEYLKQINADFGTTSPSTGDNLAAVVAVAALAGAALVITRKVK